MQADARLARLDLGSLGLELPPTIVGAAIPLGDPETIEGALASLAPEGFPGQAVAKRRAEFLAGRYVAALALTSLGAPTSIGRLDSGAPRWPHGVVGTISHGAGVAVALVARRADHAGIGVDVEEELGDDRAAGLVDLIATPHELSVAGRGLATEGLGRRFSAVFSAKESLYKCLHPQTGRFMEFTDARVVAAEPRGRDRCVLVLRVEATLDPTFVEGTFVPVEVVVRDRRTVSLCTSPRT